MDDLLREFLTETNESLGVVDVELVRFEQEPNNVSILANIFRLVHTIKGTCGFLGLPRLEALTHAAEALMGKFREGMPVTGEAVTLILYTIDRIKEILDELEKYQQEPAGSDDDLIGKLHAMFRETEPRATQRRIRIWCAAASTGQEPYSLAMALKEIGPQLAGWRTEILATDFSLEVLEKAKAGIYSQFEVQRGLPIQMLVKYFTQVGEQIAPEIRAMVQFREFNLLQNCSHLGVFDVVFCRNVLIYFDRQTKIEMLDRIAQVVDSDGYLVLGAAETVVGLTSSFRPIPDKRALYGPNPAHPRAAASARFLRSVAASSQ